MESVHSHFEILSQWDENFSLCARLAGKDFRARSRTGHTKQRQSAVLRPGIVTRTTADCVREPRRVLGRYRAELLRFPEHNFSRGVPFATWEARGREASTAPTRWRTSSAILMSPKNHTRKTGKAEKEQQKLFR